jgi:hypothetical protein
MHRTLVLAALSFISAAPAPAQDIPVLATYHADNGSLPPEYAWSTDVTILSDGTLTFTHCTGYATEPPGCTTQGARVTETAIAVIGAAATESGLAEDPAAPNPDPPIGGGGMSGTVVLDGNRIELPRDPAPADADRVAAVLRAIATAIPSRLTDDVEK